MCVNNTRSAMEFNEIIFFNVDDNLAQVECLQCNSDRTTMVIHHILKLKSNS